MIVLSLSLTCVSATSNNTQSLNESNTIVSSSVNNVSNIGLNSSYNSSIQKEDSNSNEIYVSVDGNDESGDGSYDNPYGTLQFGINKTESGGTLNVLNGTYMIDNPLIINKKITITGYDDHVVINGHGVTRLLDLGSMSSLTMNNIILTGGYADNGGVADVSNLMLATSFYKCTFINNTALKQCGVFFSSGNAMMGIFSVTSSLFLDNAAVEGGMFYGHGMLVPNLRNCFIINCSSYPFYTNNGRTQSIDYNYWGVNNPDKTFLTVDYISSVSFSTWYIPVLTVDKDSVNTGENVNAKIRFITNKGSEISDNVILPSISIVFNVIGGNLISSDSSISHSASAVFSSNDVGKMIISATLQGGQELSQNITVNHLPIYVSSSAISGQGDGTFSNPCTLEEAITKLNSKTGYSRIELLSGVYYPLDLLTISANALIKPYENSEVIISGSNLHSIFNISSGYSVEFNNISFVNASGVNGGAIILGSNSNLTVISSVFKNNKAVNGGAIYGDSTSYGNISYSQFVDNSANKGSAIYGLDSSKIIANYNWWGQNQGSAYDNTVYGNVIVNNWIISTLNTNKTTLRHSWKDNITVALKLNDLSSIDDYLKPIEVNFEIENAVLDIDSGKLSDENDYTLIVGVFRATDSVKGNATIDNQVLNFTYEFYVPMDIVYVSVDGSDLSGDGSLNNPFATIGHALNYVNEVKSTIYLLKGSYLVGLYNISNMNLTISSYNGPVYLDRSNSYNVFNVISNGNLTLNDIKFINGKDNIALSSAIHVTDSFLTVNNCLFDNGTGGGFGGYIYNTNSIVYINNSNFTNSKTFDGMTNPAIMLSGGEVYVNNCRFLNNGLVAGSNKSGNGETAFRNSGGVLVVNNTYVNNSYGSVLVNYQDGNSTIINTIIENTHDLPALNILSASKVLNVYNSTFINNDAGAIGVSRKQFLDTDNALYVENSSFINNTGTNGGAIYSQYANFIVNNCTFTNNKATNGGAIYGYYCAMNVINSNFNKNTATNMGGSIYTQGINDVVVIGDNNFTNSSAKIGGVIYSNGITTLYGNRMYSSTAVNGSYIYNAMRIGNTYLKILDNNTITSKKGKAILIYATLTDDRGNPISGGNIIIEIDGKNYTSTSNEGKVSFNYTFNKNGVYLITGNYTNSRRYITVVSTAVINIVGPDKLTTKILYSNMTQTAVDFYRGERGAYFKVVLVDSEGNLLSNKLVQIGFNGVVYKLITDANGVAKLQINLAYAGVYTFAMAFLTDDDYIGDFEVAKITITKKPTVISVPSKTYKASAQTKTLTITLKGKSAVGNSYVNAVGRTVKVTVNGKTYTAKTNSQGVATVKVSITKKGTYVVTTLFAGDSTFAAKSVTSKLIIN
ncbi:hypothetical protein BGI41_02910 [Methanobrevibacter sp. 87.7]|nr:hypothetical protein BGI41_02910 [Methanobrevibacter sp. 87.7]